MTIFGIDEKNYLQIGTIGANKQNIKMTDKVFNSAQAFSIDKKIDDGFPKAGKVIAVGGKTFVNGINSVNTKCASNREYLIKNKKPSCQLRIQIEVEK